VVVLLLLMAAAVTGCGHGEERPAAESREPLAVQVLPAAERQWSGGLEVTAGVRPYQRATPGTVLMGSVDQILKKEGDAVRRGDVLARVESRDVAARVAQAEAAVAAARAMEQNARLTKERMERLHARDAATQKNLDDAIAGYEAALANLRAAEEGVKAAEVHLAYSEITAPFDGVVAERMIEVGDLAAPGRPLFVVENISRVKVEAQIPESAAAALAPGDPVEVLVLGEVREARLSEILPAADPRSRTFTVRVVLQNGDRRLRSGMFARVRLGGAEHAVVAVPESSIVRRGPLTGLFVVGEEKTARLRWVTLGSSRESEVEVLTGLRAGESVVASPSPELEDGHPVEVR
jgi:RND family efflux transporter MFP subunit